MKKNMNEVFSNNLRNALYMAGKTQAFRHKVDILERVIQ